VLLKRRDNWWTERLGSSVACGCVTLPAWAGGGVAEQVRWPYRAPVVRTGWRLHCVVVRVLYGPGAVSRDT
jgi:hypothetical protein